MRLVLLAVTGVMLSGCAGFKAVERGEWKLVWVDPARRDAEAPRDVVTRDRYEAEVAEGNRRGWQAPAGFVFPLLHEVDAIGLQVGEVQGFRVDEATEAELFVDGAGVALFWGGVEKRDGWKVDTDVTVRESSLFVKGVKAGKATLRLVRGPQQREVTVTVQ
jgi:hypothetical protein